MLRPSPPRNKDTIRVPDCKSKTNHLLSNISVVRMVKEQEIKAMNVKLKAACFLLFISSPRQKNNSLRGCLCRQRTKIPLRLKINSDSDNRNLRITWIVVIMCKFHCLRVCNQMCLCTASPLFLNIIFKITGWPTEDRVSLCPTRCTFT